MPDKIEIKKFDPVARKHVIYKETKIKETGSSWAIVGADLRRSTMRSKDPNEKPRIAGPFTSVAVLGSAGSFARRITSVWQ